MTDQLTKLRDKQREMLFEMIKLLDKRLISLERHSDVCGQLFEFSLRARDVEELEAIRLASREMRYAKNEFQRWFLDLQTTFPEHENADRTTDL